MSMDFFKEKYNVSRAQQRNLGTYEGQGRGDGGGAKAGAVGEVEREFC